MWKKLLYSLIGVALASISIFFYYFFIKDYDIADPEVDQIIESDFQVEIPNESGLHQKETMTVNEPSSHQNDDEKPEVTEDQAQPIVANEPNETPSQAPEPKHTPSPPQKPSVDDIINKYLPAFKSLQNQAETKLIELANYAMNEYQSKKKNGDNISYSYFFQKYKSAADRLEDKTDQQFSVIYNALVSELKKNGYSKDEANKVKEHYKAVKKEREDMLIDEALSRF